MYLLEMRSLVGSSGGGGGAGGEKGYGGENIARLQIDLISDSGNPYYTFIGDVRYETAAVPEPITILLLGSGLLGLWGVRKKFKK